MQQYSLKSTNILYKWEVANKDGCRRDRGLSMMYHRGKISHFYKHVEMEAYGGGDKKTKWLMHTHTHTHTHTHKHTNTGD
jgi:hypothetical protein